MRLRKLVAEPKTQKDDTDWRGDDIPPRHAPCFVKTLPVRSGWQWRSARAAVNDNDREYVLLCRCNPHRDNWSSILILRTEDGGSVIGRFEFHGSHPGLHIHAHCDRGGLESGPTGMDNLARIPDTEQEHRRTNAWTENGFWEASKRFFRIEEEKGPLL